MAHGGKRNGAGRKSKADEEKVKNQAIEAIEQKYGSVEKGLVALMESGEASLIKFVFEHAIGKPKEKIEHSGDMAISWYETKTYDSDSQTDKSH